MKNKYVLWCVIGVLLSIFVGLITYYFNSPRLPKEIVKVDKEKEKDIDIDNGKEKEKEGDINENDESKVKEKTYYFDGWKDKQRKRVLAVIIDNAVEARPQAGLDQADVVMEFPVEGGLTRFVAIISNDNVNLIGPVRSARPYFIEVGEEYRGILVHAGGSNESIRILENDTMDHLDEIYGNFKVKTAFWRIPDRAMPHNLYTTSDTLRRTSKNLSFDNLLMQPPYRKLYIEDKEDKEVKGEKIHDINIYYSNKNCTASFVFDEGIRAFKRFTADKPHTNPFGQQLITPNVVVQYVSCSYL
ncbi:MAG: DUF3048 domain-containing protein, partial [Clostridia bacterium]|nr:DUF3048 domain-containing protein [Clostridia bacterium]